MISKDKIVALTYELRLNGTEGELVEQVGTDKPLVFLYGAGRMLPKFEAHILDKKVGDAFDFQLSAEDAYGAVQDNAIIDVAKAAFMVHGEINEELLVVGKVVPMQDKDGNRFNGRIVEVKEADVKIDFNHPLAGQELCFKGNVVEVREATAEEIAAGGVPASCGCDGGSCGEGECDDSGCEDKESCGC